jgi:predicted RNA polymerase sigma factor
LYFHGRAERKEYTDWPEIVLLYDQLERVQSSSVVALNRAVVVGMVDGPAAALAIVDAPAQDGFSNAASSRSASKARR